MKRGGLLHAELSRLVAALGHFDELVLADAGLPVPPGVPCVDLAVAPGVPALLDVARAVAGELVVAELALAEELLAGGGPLPAALAALWPDAPRRALPHAAFKARTAAARAVIRTGEFTPYANVILVAGVAF